MNKLQAIFNSLPDDELKAVMLDLQHQDETGILPAGPARNLAQRLVDEVEIPFVDAFKIVQHEPLRRAAYKWASIEAAIQPHVPESEDEKMNQNSIQDALKFFLETESDKGASGGLASEIARSLLAEAQQGGPGCLMKLPALKQSILDYAIEQNSHAELDKERHRG